VSHGCFYQSQLSSFLQIPPKANLRWCLFRFLRDALHSGRVQHGTWLVPFFNEDRLQHSFVMRICCKTEYPQILMVDHHLSDRNCHFGVPIFARTHPIQSRILSLPRVPFCPKNGEGLNTRLGNHYSVGYTVGDTWDIWDIWDIYGYLGKKW
jgi:hypothetical protein